MYVSSSGFVIDSVCALAKAVDFGCKCDITCKSAYVVWVAQGYSICGTTFIFFRKKQANK